MVACSFCRPSLASLIVDWLLLVCCLSAACLLVLLAVCYVLFLVCFDVRYARNP